MEIGTRFQNLEKKSPCRLLMSFLLSYLLMNSHFVSAHSLSVWAEFKNNKVEVKAYDSDGEILKEGKVEVRGLNGKILIQGQISKDGKFSFIPYKKQDLVITVVLNLSHQGEFWLTEDDFL